MAERHREEVLNVVLATCLSSRGIEADPETILRRGQSRPDVIALFRGLRCAIEGKVGDTIQPKATVIADARGRIDQGIAHLAIAVVYPEALRSISFGLLQGQLNSAVLEFSVLTDPSEPEAWHTGGINQIVAELRRAHDVIVRDDVLQQSVNTLNIGLADMMCCRPPFTSLHRRWRCWHPRLALKRCVYIHCRCAKCAAAKSILEASTMYQAIPFKHS
jgi:hypothetical protein